MKVLDIKPVANSGGGSVRAVAVFDLQLTDEIRMHGLKLMEAPGGRRIVYAPSGNGGRRLATFSPALAAAITDAATAKMRGQDTADGTTSKN